MKEGKGANGERRAGRRRGRGGRETQGFLRGPHSDGLCHRAVQAFVGQLEALDPSFDSTLDALAHALCHMVRHPLPCVGRERSGRDSVGSA